MGKQTAKAKKVYWPNPHEPKIPTPHSLIANLDEILNVTNIQK